MRISKQSLILLFVIAAVSASGAQQLGPIDRIREAVEPFTQCARPLAGVERRGRDPVMRLRPRARATIRTAQ